MGQCDNVGECGTLSYVSQQPGSSVSANTFIHIRHIQSHLLNRPLHHSAAFFAGAFFFIIVEAVHDWW